MIFKEYFEVFWKQPVTEHPLHFN